jgi:hypothetical protein
LSWSATRYALYLSLSHLGFANSGVISQAVSLNDGYADSVDSTTAQRAAAGGAPLAQAALLALRLLSLAVIRQDSFIASARASSADLPSLSPVEQLLIRSSSHAVDIARLVGHDDPMVALAAVRLLALLAPNMPQLPAVLSDTRSAGVVTRAFSRRIESDTVVDSEGTGLAARPCFISRLASSLLHADAGGNGPDDDGGSLRTATLALLYSSLASREPALAHFLLGVSASSVAPPPAPRGCLRAVLSLMRLEAFLRADPRTYEMCLSIVHALCASRVTGAHVMQLLRMAEPSALLLCSYGFLLLSRCSM